MFSNTVGNDPDVISDLLETKYYTITVNFLYGQQLVLSGSFDRNGLPTDFPELAEHVLNFMQFYGMGEILDSAVYRMAKRKSGNYIFCSVEFDEGGKRYYYLTDDDTLRVGDFVLVPAGKNEHTAVVEIVDIEYFPENEVPFLLDKVKRIIRRCTNEDFDTPVEQESDSFNVEGTMYALSEEPLKDTSPSDIRSWLQNHTTEQDLAHAFAQVHNQTGWLMYDLDDDTNEELEKAYEAWWALEMELCEFIVKILELENANDTKVRRQAGKGTHYIVTPFMLRNDYKDGGGWWVKECGAPK